MTELSQALGLEGTVEHGGKTYRLGPITLEVMGAWEDWLAGETLDRLLRFAARSGGSRAEAFDSVAKLSAEGVFDFFGETSQKRLTQLSGQKKITYFRILQHHPDIDSKTVAEIVEAEWDKLFLLVQKDLAAQLALDPNEGSPATPGPSQHESDGDSSLPPLSTQPDGQSQPSAA